MFADRGGRDLDDRLGELADLHEVLAALAVTLGFSDEEVHAAAASQADEARRLHAAAVIGGGDFSREYYSHLDTPLGELLSKAFTPKTNELCLPQADPQRQKTRQEQL